MRQQRNGIIAILIVSMMGPVIVSSERNDDPNGNPAINVHPFFDASTLTPEEKADIYQIVLQMEHLGDKILWPESEDNEDDIKSSVFNPDSNKEHSPDNKNRYDKETDGAPGGEADAKLSTYPRTGDLTNPSRRRGLRREDNALLDFRELQQMTRPPRTRARMGGKGKDGKKASDKSSKTGKGGGKGMGKKGMGKKGMAGMGMGMPPVVPPVGMPVGPPVYPITTAPSLPSAPSVTDPATPGPAGPAMSLAPGGPPSMPAGPTPEPTPAPTQRPTPDPTPSPNQQPNDGPTPDPTPEPTQDPVVGPTPDPTPGPSGGPTPDPTPQPTPGPGPTPDPTPGPTGGPTPDPTPQPTPGPGPGPDPTPGPTPDPTPQPTQDPGPGPTPDPTPPTGTGTAFPTPTGPFTRCFVEDSPIIGCPDQDIGAMCDKYNPIASFQSCFATCIDAFCCIHDSASTRATSCSEETNCVFYDPCYIIWFKLHDTIGPAPYLRLEQDEAFYDVNTDDFVQIFNDRPDFFDQFFGHHFLTDDLPLTDDTFTDSNNW